MPGGPELEGQNTSGKSEVRARLPRPHFCNTGPDYLVGQITWSRPKVGQIAWARAWSIGEGRRGEGRGEDGDGVLTRTISSAGHAVVRGSARHVRFFFCISHQRRVPPRCLSSTDPRP